MASCAKNCVKRNSDTPCAPVKTEDICNDPKAEPISLEQMADHYCKFIKEEVEKWLNSLTEGQPKDLWFSNFICGEANISNNPVDGKFCKNSHQFRMPSQTIMAARHALENAALDNLNNFEEILEKVVSITRKEATNQGIPQFGDLACYDFTLRYAFRRGIRPEYVYVHAGTLTGLKHLENYLGYKIKTIRHPKLGIKFEPKALPEQLSKLVELGGLHIEHFLCINHNPLEKLSAQKKAKHSPK